MLNLVILGLMRFPIRQLKREFNAKFHVVTKIIVIKLDRYRFQPNHE